jgi:hypothetical protein
LLLQLCHVLQKRYAYFDAVVSSDLQRTLQTAQIVAAPHQLQVMTVITVVPSDSALLIFLSCRRVLYCFTFIRCVSFHCFTVRIVNIQASNLLWWWPNIITQYVLDA